MIDEELYQQAADELNTNKRRPHLWARACALASDDHDEARFLYTNLRVEELLAERANNGPDVDNLAQADVTLGLAPLDETIADDDIPSSVSTPAGVDAPDAASDGLRLEAFDGDTFLPQDPDAELMADYVPEKHDALDDTYAGDEIAEAEFELELESFKAEQANNPTLDETGADLTQTLDDELHKDTTELVDNIDLAQTPADEVLQGSGNGDSETAEFTLDHPGDLTQANVQVLEAHTNELDSMLEDTAYKPDQPAKPDEDLDWLDAEMDSTDVPDNTGAPREPLIIEDDPLTDELTRQADELDIGSQSDETADVSQQIAEQLAMDDSFPKPAYESDEHTATEQVSDLTESTQDASEPDALPAAATIAAASALAVGAPDLSSPRQYDSVGTEDREHEQVGIEHTFPLDLRPGRAGKEYFVYRRDQQAQAVKKGVSWSALLLTLPYLLYRQLFGTALAYAVLWIIAIGGLVISGLAWLDGGSDVTPLLQACTIGFGLLAFIGLVYLPFRYGNEWRANNLENRGFDLVARATATNPGRAIARARRHSALGS